MTYEAPVATIDAIRPHPKADRIELAEILGNQVVVGKGNYKPGDVVVYVPADSQVPEKWVKKWEIEPYVSDGRVRCARLRGEPSFGFTVPMSELPTGAWHVGQDVAPIFGLTKWEPPFKAQVEGAVKGHSLFESYTDILDIRSHPEAFADGDWVVCTEKIHGTNSRVGSIEGDLMVGSKTTRFKEPKKIEESLYWHPTTIPGVRALVEEMGTRHKQVILFGEIYGKVQNLHYGLPKGVGYAAFDLLVDGHYVDWDTLVDTCELYEIPLVPVIAHGSYTPEMVKSWASGQTSVQGGRNHREGIVVRGSKERWDLRLGRVILKYVSDEHRLSGKNDPNEYGLAA